MGKGFYKLSDGKLIYAQNYVLNKDYQLYADCCKRRLIDGQWVALTDEHECVDYTENNVEIVDGWFWFDNIENAKTHFGVVEEPAQAESTHTGHQRPMPTNQRMLARTV